MTTIFSHNPILVVNFPGEQCLREMIEAIQNTELDTDIVIVAQNIKELPFKYPRVEFVQGSVTSEETYLQADLDKAKKVIVLRSSEEPTISDSVTAAIVALIKLRRPTVFVSAECLSLEHSKILKHAGVDEIVHTNSIINNLLTQSIHDPGISELLDTITGKHSKYCIFRTPIGKLHESYCTYPLFAKRLIDKGYYLVAMKRENQLNIKFRGNTLKQGDDVFYVGAHRLNWIEIKNEAKAPE